jgi:HPt (histidine-containing phosphotransfer) domain-containing protein
MGGPVDLVHLARYTGGDSELNAEILKLFETQANDLVAQLQALLDAGDAKGWHSIHHSLKGAARGIGAFALADAAAAAETLDPCANSGQALAALGTLKERAEAVHEFIEDYLTR